MKHARLDYNRFQDPENKILENEPVMIFRAQDRHAAAIVAYAARLYREDPDVDNEMAELVQAHAELMQKWEVKKAPDMPNQPKVESNNGSESH